MKRQKLPKPLTLVGTVYPIFFWRPCCECGNFFRWEHGFYATFDYSPYKQRFMCEECGGYEEHLDKGSNLAKAALAFIEWDKKRRKNRPSPPPPPPRKPFSSKRTPSILKDRL